jgi:hypothetical protein
MESRMNYFNRIMLNSKKERQRKQGKKERRKKERQKES